MKLEKIIVDSKGEIVIRVMSNLEGKIKEDDVSVAEIVTRGCVIGFYKLRLIDKIYWVAEFREVDNRLTSIKLDEGNLELALYWGRKIANTVIDFWLEGSEINEK